MTHSEFAIATPGRGVVIEGPSGVGKTTAVRQALAEAGQSGHQYSQVGEHILTAKSPDDVKSLSHIEKWHTGAVVIDDFHCLNAPSPT